MQIQNINGLIIRDCDIQHLIRHNFVIVSSGFICVTDKLWAELMKNKENQELIEQFETK